MSLLLSIFFGLIQGLTEFLPISSTAHLTLFGKLFNVISLNNPENWTAFMAVIQLGTLFAVVVYFFKDILHIIKSFWKDNIIKRISFSKQSHESKMGWFVIIGTIPVAVIGLLLKKQIEGTFTKSLFVIGISLILWGLLLGLAEKIAKHKRGEKDLTWQDALLVGIGQMFALIPGSSRSGTTITAGLCMGLSRETAARFSFLLSLPAVLASGLLELKDSLHFIDTSMMISYIVGIVVAFIVGWFAIDFLLKFLKNRSTWIFVWYRVLLGFGILFFLQLSFFK